MARFVVKSGHQRTCITMSLDHMHQIYADHRRFNNKHNWEGLLTKLRVSFSRNRMFTLGLLKVLQPYLASAELE